MRCLSVIAVAVSIVAAPAWGQTPPLTIQQLIQADPQLQQQQRQPQEIFERNQAERQRQIQDHADIRQQNADMAARIRADLDRQSATVQPVDPSASSQAKALVDQAAQPGIPDAPTPLQVLPR